MTAIVVPLKNLDRAKSRLHPVLADRERRGLVTAMLGDVLAALPAHGAGCRIFVVAEQEVSLPGGVVRIPEPANRGYDEAVATALCDPRVSGAPSMLVLPADLPMATRSDIDALLDSPPVPGMRIAPARDGDGTNALLLSPPDLVPTRFGAGSAERHRALGAAAGVPVESVFPAGLAFDIDTPQDLAEFCATDGQTGTHRYLRQTGVSARLDAQHVGRPVPPKRG